MHDDTEQVAVAVHIMALILYIFGSNVVIPVSLSVILMLCMSLGVHFDLCPLFARHLFFPCPVFFTTCCRLPYVVEGE